MLSREEKKGYRWIRLEARIADRGEKSLVTFAVLRIKKDAAIIAIGILADIYIRGIAKWEKGQAVNQDTKLIG